MRVAILTDIHANLPALEAVLEACTPFDAVWVMGDTVPAHTKENGFP